ncbi:sodium-dependent glucose transporter 1-like [Tetranychus urticae]|uniref:Major facilitator superfamily (MFS) profile domain-containing protein n=1 Tax=Tetranychus urticae TaxID=32264 RepID=T1K1Y9_TETUR|nr:sodium-dependent glucose transporter 1-like [Tetranychus urticae]
MDFANIHILVCVYVLQFTMGLVYEVVSPTMDELKAVTSSSDEKMALIYSLRSTGYVFGSLIGGRIYQFTIPLLSLCCAVCINSVTIGLAGQTYNIKLLFSIFFINGFTTGMMDVGTNVWILRLFSDRSGPYIMALVTSFSLGTVLAPLYTAHFLQEFPSPGETSKIYIPYLITCVFELVALVGLIYLLIKQSFLRYEKRNFFARREKNYADGNTDEPSNQESTSLNMKIIIFLALCMIMVYSGMEIIWSEYLIPMLNRSKLNLSSSTTAKIKSTSNAAHAIGKIVFIGVTAFIRPDQIILFDSTIITISTIMLLIFYNSSSTGIWIFSVLFGIGTSSLYPSIYPFIQTFIAVDYIKGSYLICASSLTDVIAPILIGNHLESTPNLILYLELVTMAIVFASTFSIKILGSRLLSHESINNNENGAYQLR